MNGANPNIQDELGRTALHYAFVKGLIDNVKVLLEWGSDINIVDNSGNNLFQIADTVTKKQTIPYYEEMLNYIDNRTRRLDLDPNYTDTDSDTNSWINQRKSIFEKSIIGSKS